MKRLIANPTTLSVTSLIGPPATVKYKIALVEPKGSGVNVFALSKMPRGVALLAALLQMKGHDVTCYVESLQPFSFRELSDNGYDIICFSDITCTSDRSHKLSQKLRARGFDGQIYFGGPHASAYPEQTILQSGADAVIRQEGEITLCELIDLAAQEAGMKPRQFREEMSNLLGMTWVDEGRIRHNLDRPLLTCQQLSTLPLPAFDTILGFENMAQIPFMFTRGCPWDCEFCAACSQFGPVYRFAEVEWRLNQLRQFKRRYYQLWLTKPYFFVDDNFFGGKDGRELTLEFLRRAKAEELIPPEGYICQVQVVDATPEVAQALKESGCIMVCLGIESDDPETLKLMNKPQNHDLIMAGLNNLADAGIKTLAMTIVGADTDTRKSIKGSMRRLRREGNAYYLMISCMTPLPGTRYTWRLIRTGRRFSSNNRNFNGLHAVVAALRMSTVEISLSFYENMAWFYFWTWHGRHTMWEKRGKAARMLLLMLAHVASTPGRLLSEYFSRK